MINQLRRSRVESQASYDLLTNRSGKTVRGDSPGLAIDANYFGKKYRFNRDDLLQISRKQESEKSVPHVNGYRVFSKIHDSFYRDSMNSADFEKGENEVALKTGSDLFGLYAYLGCLFECEGKGNEIKVDPYDVTGRSPRQSAVCFDYSYENSARYKGVFRSSFCAQAQSKVRATTNKVGCFLQMINPPRTIVFEAYNLDDELVGICEAIESTSFVGLESGEPIAYVRVLTNKHLKMLNDAEADNDFAVDDFTFAAPKRSLFQSYQDLYSVVLKNGDYLRCKFIAVADGKLKLTGVSIKGTDELTVDISKVASLSPPANKLVERSKQKGHQAFVRLKDHSVVAIQKIGSGASNDFPSLKIDENNIVAIWGLNTLCRHAQQEDFDRAKPIVVFPTLRKIAADVELNSEGVSWDGKSAEVVKQTYEQYEDVTDPEYENEFELANCPTIWFSALNQSNDSWGMIRLTDGQRFTLGGSQGFKIANWDADSVTIANENEKIAVPMTHVRNIIFKK